MKRNTIAVALTTVVLLVGARLSFAVENAAGQAGEAGGQAKMSTKSTKSSKNVLAAKRKAAAKIKLVDINSATKAELVKLPGVSDADADKIISGRPYGTKAWLLTHNILSAETYASVQPLVVAKQPYKDAAANAALYAPKNKK